MRYADNNHSALKAGLACVMVTLLAVPARGAPARQNRLRSVQWHQTGAVTLVTLATSSRPTFTVYKMAGPDRVVVDLANTVPGIPKGVKNVGTWAVSSLAVSQSADRRSSLTRVVITFRRRCFYHIETQASKVVIKVTAFDAPPPDRATREAQVQARRAAQLEAETRRLRQSEQSARRALAEQKAMTEAARREAARLRRQTEQLKASERRAWERFRKARSEADAAKSRAELARQKADTAKKLADRLRGSAKEVQARMAWARAEIQAARLESQRARAEVRSLKSKLSGLKLKAKRLKIAARQARQRADRLKTQSARLAAKTAEAKWLAAQKQAAAQDAMRYKAQAAEAKAENRRIRAELERLRIEARQARRRAVALRTKTARLAALAAQAKLRAAEQLASKRAEARYRAQIESARADAERVRAELEKIKADAARARREALSYKSQSVRAKKRLEAIRSELAQAKKAALAVARRASRNHGKVADYRIFAKKADMKAKRLARRLAVLILKRRKMERDQKALRAKLAASQREMAAAKQRAKILSERLAEAKSLVHKREQQVDRYKQSLRMLRRAQDSASQRRRRELEAALAQARRRLARAQKRYATARRERDRSRKARRSVDRTLQRLERQVAEREALLARIEQETDRAVKLKAAALKQKRLLEAKVAALLVRYQSLQMLSEKVAGRHERLKRAYEALQVKLKTVREAVAEELQRAETARAARRRQEALANQAEKQRALLAKMTKAIARRKAEIAALEGKLHSVKGRQKNRIVSGLASARKRLAQLLQSVSINRRRLARIEMLRDQAVRSLQEATTHAEEARRKLEAADAARLKAQAAVRRSLEELKRIQAQKRREIAVKERLVAGRIAEERRLASLMHKRRKLEDATASLTRDMKRAEKRLASAERAQKIAQRRLERIHRELAAEEARRRKLVEENNRLTAKLRLVRSQVLKRRRHGKPRRTRFAVRGKVYDVGFRDTGATHRITVRVAGPFDYDIKRAGRKIFVELYGVRLRRRLERSLDTSAFRGPVKMVSAYQERKRKGVVDLLVELGHAARFRVNRSRGALWIDFPKNSHPQMARTRAEVRASRVGGYRSTVAMAPTRPSGVVPRSRWYRRRYGVKGRYLGPTIDLDFKDADIHNLLRLIGLVWKKNIVVSDDVQGRVTIRMSNVRAGRALEVILKSKGLGMVWEGRNIIRIAKQEDIQKEIEEHEKANQIKRTFEPVVMRVIRVAYGDAEAIAKQIEANVLSKRGKVTFNKRTNAIIIRDVAANISIAKKLIRTLDTPTAQVVIEARIVEARSTFLREVGIQWGGNLLASPGTGMPTGLMFPFSIGAAGGAMDQVSNTHGIIGAGAANPNFAVNLPATVGNGQGGAMGFSFGTLGGAVNINLRLSAMEETGRVRIISSPRITTLDNVQATIQQGVRIPISVVSAQGVNTQFEEANLGLTVTPHVTSDGRVRLKIKVEKNEPDFVNTGARGDPTILKKSAQTEMLVPNGDTAVIGGIYQRTTATSYSKVPWFADIPIIGWLFKHRKQSDERSEVLIFITPRVVRNTSPGRAERNGR